MLTHSGPRVEGGMVVAPSTFGRFAGDLLAPDEYTSKVYAFTPSGQVRLVVRTGVPSGGDIGTESLGIVPAQFGAGARLRPWLPARQRQSGRQRDPQGEPGRADGSGRQVRGAARRQRGWRRHGRRQLLLDVPHPRHRAGPASRPRRGPRRLHGLRLRSTAGRWGVLCLPARRQSTKSPTAGDSPSGTPSRPKRATAD